MLDATTSASPLPDRLSSPGDDPRAVRALAFYLPQFHPVPENDAFWGPGFTDWRNVVRARPRFPGHRQPHLPADLGFYDLRLAETRQAQARLARSAGLSGFCWYHYWFAGKRVLDRPFRSMLASREEDFPFMLCWANENWTRAWDGSARQVLIAQDYSDADTRAHAQALIPAFDDARAIRIDGRPVFAVYAADALPDPARWTERFRETLRPEGIEPYLLRVERWQDRDRRPPAALGFDAGVEFQPFSRNFDAWLRARPDLAQAPLKRARHRLRRQISRFRPLDRHHDMAAFVAYDIAAPRPDYTLFPGVCPSWDNSARRPPGRAIIFRNTDPALFAHWTAAKRTAFQPQGEANLMFVNAWNEWAEGNHLEPCLAYNMGWIAALQQSLGKPSARTRFSLPIPGSAP